MNSNLNYMNTAQYPFYSRAIYHEDQLPQELLHSLSIKCKPQLYQKTSKVNRLYYVLNTAIYTELFV
ncbi:hypothetical protein HanXRQr2_Chr15g0678071 [Helianthus annuus]|uniref:Uncharacterized protein n=1 Tax=Helianthus annuus TaxID=4232 RepID=A0A9K3DZ59_HELAN|nr:hypothetical protein HanXRQr2_Chr15g0678071 [Helianthus annuus]